MSIRLGPPDNIIDIISQIRENDELFFKIFIRIHNDDMKGAYSIIRNMSVYGFMDCRYVVARIKEIYNPNQIKALLAYISKENPEYVI